MNLNPKILRILAFIGIVISGILDMHKDENGNFTDVEEEKSKGEL